MIQFDEEWGLNPETVCYIIDPISMVLVVNPFHGDIMYHIIPLPAHLINLVVMVTQLLHSVAADYNGHCFNSAHSILCLIGKLFICF